MPVGSFVQKVNQSVVTPRPAPTNVKCRWRGVRFFGRDAAGRGRFFGAYCGNFRLKKTLVRSAPPGAVFSRGEECTVRCATKNIKNQWLRVQITYYTSAKPRPKWPSWGGISPPKIWPNKSQPLFKAHLQRVTITFLHHRSHPSER